MIGKTPWVVPTLALHADSAVGSVNNGSPQWYLGKQLTLYLPAHSGYISTSKEASVAIRFASNKPNSYVYTIRADLGAVVDVNWVLGDKCRFPKEKEIEFPFGVNSADVLEAHAFKNGVMRAPRKTCCAVEWLRCSVLVPSPYSLYCLGFCARCALPSDCSRRFLEAPMSDVAIINPQHADGLS